MQLSWKKRTLCRKASNVCSSRISFHIRIFPLSKLQPLWPLPGLRVVVQDRIRVILYLPDGFRQSLEPLKVIAQHQCHRAQILRKRVVLPALCHKRFIISHGNPDVGRLSIIGRSPKGIDSRSSGAATYRFCAAKPNRNPARELVLAPQPAGKAGASPPHLCVHPRFKGKPQARRGIRRKLQFPSAAIPQFSHVYLLLPTIARNRCRQDFLAQLVFLLYKKSG